MSIAFNIEDPKARPRILHHLAMIGGRRISQVDALHYFETALGVYCLDLNLIADNEEELDRLVIDYFYRNDPEKLLPAASTELWLRMVNSHMKYAEHRILKIPHVKPVVIATTSEKINA